jgi:hypothetical protein
MGQIEVGFFAAFLAGVYHSINFPIPSALALA